MDIFMDISMDPWTPYSLSMAYI